MRKFYNKGTYVMSAFLIGTMIMSGCGASGNSCDMPACCACVICVGF